MNKDLTPWEKYLQKRKDKKKEKRLAQKVILVAQLVNACSILHCLTPFIL